MSANESMEASGFNRREYTNSETYNVFRGVFNGAVQTFKVFKPDPPVPARLDVTAMVKSAGAKDAKGAVDYLLRRFLIIEPRPADRQDMIRYLEQRLGNSAIDFDRKGLETDLRETLHLVMSLPEYQLD
jgi:hypothetical protein